MLSNFWYPICPADGLERGAVIDVRLFNKPIALFRDQQGHCHALEDACAHRSAPLSAGKVIGDTLRCPYHGWRYGGDGQCQHIPTFAEDRPIAPQVKVSAFPVMEACGLVWLWPGDPKAATDWPEMAAIEQDYFGSPDWRVSNYQRQLDFRHSLLIENLLDPAHIHFVHAGTMSRPENAGPVEPELTMTEQGFFHTRRGSYGVFSAFQGPALVALYFNFGPGSEHTQLFYCIPETDTTMRLLTRIYTQVGSRRPHASIIASIEQVLGEDIAVLEQVEKRLREGYPQIGLIVDADRAIMEYHRWCRNNRSDRSPVKPVSAKR